MPDSRSATLAAHRSLLTWIVQLAFVALLVRTWLVLGLLQPVYVSGSSMAPAFPGAHVRASCFECLHSYLLDADQPDSVREIQCPHCLQANLRVADPPASSGRRLWIDRTGGASLSKARWTPVVLSCPDSGRFCLKRIVGLPGESITIRGGDVFVDQQRLVKTMAEQRRMRILVHEESHRASRWIPEPRSSWREIDQGWQSSGDRQWLAYQHPGDRVITDALPYNAARSLMLHRQVDLMVSASVRQEVSGGLRIKVSCGSGDWVVDLPPGKRTVTAMGPGGQESRRELSRESIDTAQSGEFVIEVSTFDGRLSIAIDGRDELVVPLPPVNASAAGIARPFAMATSEEGAELTELRLWRDLYYVSSPPPGQARAAAASAGPDEIYVLGDNSAVSVDSRTWGPVSVRRIVGRPIGAN